MSKKQTVVTTTTTTRRYVKIQPIQTQTQHAAYRTIQQSQPISANTFYSTATTPRRFSPTPSKPIHPHHHHQYNASTSIQPPSQLSTTYPSLPKFAAPSSNFSIYQKSLAPQLHYSTRHNHQLRHNDPYLTIATYLKNNPDIDAPYALLRDLPIIPEDYPWIKYSIVGYMYAGNWHPQQADRQPKSTLQKKQDRMREEKEELERRRAEEQFQMLRKEKEKERKREEEEVVRKAAERKREKEEYEVARQAVERERARKEVEVVQQAAKKARQEQEAKVIANSVMNKKNEQQAARVKESHKKQKGSDQYNQTMNLIQKKRSIQQKQPFESPRLLPPPQQNPPQQQQNPKTIVMSESAWQHIESQQAVISRPARTVEDESKLVKSSVTKQSTEVSSIRGVARRGEEEFMYGNVGGVGVQSAVVNQTQPMHNTPPPIITHQSQNLQPQPPQSPPPPPTIPQPNIQLQFPLIAQVQSYGRNTQQFSNPSQIHEPSPYLQQDYIITEQIFQQQHKLPSLFKNDSGMVQDIFNVGEQQRNQHVPAYNEVQSQPFNPNEFAPMASDIGGGQMTSEIRE